MEIRFYLRSKLQKRLTSADRLCGITSRMVQLSWSLAITRGPVESCLYICNMWVSHTSKAATVAGQVRLRHSDLCQKSWLPFSPIFVW
jgi:hypothetical protein